MIKPMKAVPMSKGNILDWSDWAIEEKYDGWRLIVQVPKVGNPRAWTRPRKHAGAEGKTMLEYQLPELLAQELRQALAVGVYDGELLGGDTSTDVNRVDLRQKVSFVVFDVLQLRGESVMLKSYDIRGQMLVQAFRKETARVKLAPRRPITEQEDVTRFVKTVWARGGEGAILKRRASVYLEDKRSPDWVKVKKLLHETMTVIGFEAGRGEKVDRGPFAMVKLQGEKGQTSVKTRNDAELAAFAAAMPKTRAGMPFDISRHPAIGRKLVVEFNDWTPKDGYRHPRWDRWEDE